MINDKLQKEYEEYVEYFDPTPQYAFDEPYRLLSFEEWLEERDDWLRLRVHR